jgi:hypothetical protein
LKLPDGRWAWLWLLLLGWLGIGLLFVAVFFVAPWFRDHTGWVWTLAIAGLVATGLACYLIGHRKGQSRGWRLAFALTAARDALQAMIHSDTEEDWLVYG